MPKNRATDNNDLTGKVFSRLTVLHRALTVGSSKNSRWWCRCVCGVEKSLTRPSLVNGYAKSCGCLAREFPNRKRTLTGRVFGFLTVVREDLDKVDQHARWWCRCVCGVEKSINSNHLLCGRTISCGCKKNEIIGAANRTHGKSVTREYRIWTGMHRRCHKPDDPAYKYYGGRGICVDPRWESFETFLTDVGLSPSPKHGIDRYPDNDGNYEPRNVRWATQAEQNGNTRSNRRLTYAGRTQTLAAWARETGVKGSTIRTRLGLGWSVEKTLTTPVSSPERTWSRKKKDHNVD